MRLKSLFWVVVLLLAIPVWGDGLQTNTFTTVVPGSSIRLINTGIGFHKLTWNVVSGSPLACTVALDSSVDGVTWTPGGVIIGQTCTANGASAIVNLVVNYVRINMTALTAGTTVAVTWNGYNNNPASGGGGTVTSISATAPIVVTPNPITGAGTVSCPTCTTSSATIGGTITATHLTYATGPNTASDVAGSAVTGGTGAIALTAGADTTDPLQILSHSITQSASLLDLNHQSTGGGGLGTLAAPLVVEGRGLGAFDPSNLKTLVAIQQESQATAGAGLVLTNKQAVGSSSRTSTIELGVPDNGVGQIIGGNAVGDGSGHYSGLQFDQNSSLYGTSSQPGALAGTYLSDGEGQAIFTIWEPIGLAGPPAGNTFQIARGTAQGFPLAGFDSGGLPGSAAIPINLFFNGTTSGTAKLGVAAAAGTPCIFLLPTTSPSAGQMLQSAAPSGGSCQTSWTGTPAAGFTVPINNVVSATGAITPINIGTNLLNWQCGQTSTPDCFKITNSTPVPSTVTNSHMLWLSQSQGDYETAFTIYPAGDFHAASGINALNVMYVQGLTGGAAGASQNGFQGAGVSMFAGDGSAGGATTGTGGTGGTWSIGGGNGGAAGGTSSNAGGNGGAWLFNTGNGGAGGATGNGGNATVFTFNGGAGGAAGATSGTGGIGGDINFSAGNGGTAAVGSTTGRGGNFQVNLGQAGLTGTPGVPGRFIIGQGAVLGSNVTETINIQPFWNTTGVVNGVIFVSVTDTASAPTSKFEDFQISGSSKWALTKGGNVISVGPYTFNGSTSGSASIGATATAGTPAQINLPTATGAAGAVLTTDGNTPQQSSWQVPTSLSCAYQGPLSAVVGTGAAATFYTCSVPALGVGQGIAITATARHTTGTANVAYTVQFGGTSTTASTPTGAANQIEVFKCLLMNNPGSTTAQTVTTTYQDSAAGTNVIVLNTMAINTGSAQTLNLQFNVAATDQVTPEQFLVQLVR